MKSHDDLRRLTLIVESTAGQSQEQHQAQALAALQAQATHFGPEREETRLHFLYVMQCESEALKTTMGEEARQRQAINASDASQYTAAVLSYKWRPKRPDAWRMIKSD